MNFDELIEVLKVGEGVGCDFCGSCIVEVDKLGGVILKEGKVFIVFCNKKSCFLKGLRCKIEEELENGVVG